jgi:hypothetical protein
MVLPGVKVKDYDLIYRPEIASLYEQTRNVVLFKDVWQLEFSFLTLRQLEVDIPTPAGTIRRNVWYLVYRVRNVGANVSHKKRTDPKFGHVDHDLVKDVDKLDETTLPYRFFPRFILQGWVERENAKSGEDKYRKVAYTDTILPTVVDAIQREEDPNRELLDSIEISKVKLPVEKSKNDGGVWGVAVFIGVDPNVDYVSVEVEGLSNAYRMQKTKSGPNFQQKTLQLNFWRPGDEKGEARDEIDYGIPLVDDPKEQVNITKRYNLPGPMLRIYELDLKLDQYQLKAEADSEVDQQDFTSKAPQKLDAGSLTKAVISSMANAGIEIEGNPSLEQKVSGLIWQFKTNVDGAEKTYEIRFEPQFWERSGDGIRFLKRLDHIWRYR